MDQKQNAEKAQSYERRRQVLRVLAEHGPLSANALAVCLPTSSNARSLREVLTRLHHRGVLTRRHDQAVRRVFHQIRQSPDGREAAAKILKIEPTALAQPHFRHAELLHSQDCAIWTELLRLLFPNTLVRREHQYASDPNAQALLLSRADERDFLPDILVTHEAEAPCERITFAVEIERTAKSRSRLLRKLRRYTDQTRLDGLIYVTSNDALQSRLLDVYESKVLARALRINHYGRNFLLFADGALDPTRSEPRMFNASLQAISLRAWVNTLHERRVARRDSHFEKPHLP